MNYREQRVITIFVIVTMVLLVMCYIVTNVIGLYILSNGINNRTYEITECKPRPEPHHYKVIIILPEPVEIVPPPEPTPQPISEDTYLLAQIINAEARNQPYDGMVAVGNVIMNRIVSPKFPDTVRDVVYQKGQFSPVNDGSINNAPSESAIQAAKDVMNGHKVIGDDVLFFYEPNIATDSWIRTRQVVTKIGDHVFAL